MREAKTEDATTELAKNIAAAVTACRLGLVSVDYARKRYVDGKPLADNWVTIAKILLDQKVDIDLGPVQ